MATSRKLELAPSHPLFNASFPPVQFGASEQVERQSDRPVVNQTGRPATIDLRREGGAARRIDARGEKRVAFAFAKIEARVFRRQRRPGFARVGRGMSRVLFVCRVTPSGKKRHVVTVVWMKCVIFCCGCTGG